MAFTIYKAKTVINWIIKRIISALSLYLLYELGSVVHVLFVYFRKSEPVRIRFGIVWVNKFIFRSYIYIHEVYT